MQKDFDFFVPQEKFFGETIKPLEQMIGADLEKTKIIISGFPYDEGTIINGGRAGGAVASKVFRQTLKTVELYCKNDILVFDSGDIPNDLLLEEAHRVQQQKHTKILSLEPHNYILFCIGGSNDQSYPNFCSLISNNQDKKIGVINIDSHFDVRPLKEGKAHSGSPFRLMIEDNRYKKNQNMFVEFAVKGAACSNAHYEYLQANNAKVYWLQTNIRRHKCDENIEYKTQAGQLFYEIMQEFEKKVDLVFVSFDVDSINSKWMPGVSAPSVIGGLTSEEAYEIIKIAGRSKKVQLVDFSEFNPAVEAFLSSHLLCELFYHLSMSCAERSK